MMKTHACNTTSLSKGLVLKTYPLALKPGDINESTALRGTHRKA
jgi:hypothetical protein